MMLILPMQRIYKFIILLVSWMLLYIAPSFSQDKVEAIGTETEKSWYQGVKVELDVASLAISAFSRETYSAEANVQLNIKQKFFPVIELGFAGANKVSVKDYGFKTNGFFTRIGMDYNLLKVKEDDTSAFNKMFFIGARFALSPFSYSMTNIVIEDDYWGEELVLNYYDQRTTAMWFEVLAGIKVEVFKNWYMGWSLRGKMKIGKVKEGELHPWYIPGLGIQGNASVNWAFNYTIGILFK